MTDERIARLLRQALEEAVPADLDGWPAIRRRLDARGVGRQSITTRATDPGTATMYHTGRVGKGEASAHRSFGQRALAATNVSLLALAFFAIASGAFLVFERAADRDYGGVGTTVSGTTPTAIAIGAATSARPSVAAIPTIEPPIMARPPQGRPAIVPTNPGAPLGLPTFDAAAASAYALADQPWQLTFAPSGAVTVASVEFLTGTQLPERGVSPGYKHADDRLFCLVIVTGDFAYAPPLPGNEGPLGQPSRLSAVYVLYDARTGSHIGMGGFR